MITGVEVAGLVLAVVPVLFSALDFYGRGLERLNDAKHYSRNLRSLRRDLSCQINIFQNTVERLLQNAVPADYVQPLLTNPNGPLWSSEEVQRRLRLFLGCSFYSFCETLTEFKIVVVELHEKVQEGVSGSGSKPCLNINRLKYTLCREKRRDLRSRLSECNKLLSKLTADSVELFESRSRRSTDFRAVRDKALHMHEALKCAPWDCQCETPHSASLRLESRIATFACPAERLQTQIRELELRFRVLFHSEGQPRAAVDHWRETDIVPVPNDGVCNVTGLSKPESASSNTVTQAARYMATYQAIATASSTCIIEDPPSKKVRKSVKWDPKLTVSSSACQSTTTNLLNQPHNLGLIRNFCAMLQQVAEGRGCLGRIVAHQKAQSFSLIAVRHHAKAGSSDNIISLGDVLQNRWLAPTASTEKSVTTILRHVGFEKRNLALCLASTVLQLHDTPWLKHSLAARSVMFLRSAPVNGRLIIRQPFVSEKFAARSDAVRALELAAADQRVSSAAVRQRIVRNETLFQLGLLLIELWFGQPFRTLSTQEDDTINRALPELSEFFTATRLLDRVSSEAGRKWSDAIRRCIRCDFDIADSSLENEDFRRAVFQGVVVPLEEDLKHFCDGQPPAED